MISFTVIFVIQIISILLVIALYVFISYNWKEDDDLLDDYESVIEDATELLESGDDKTAYRLLKRTCNRIEGEE